MVWNGVKGGTFHDRLERCPIHVLEPAGAKSSWPCGESAVAPYAESVDGEALVHRHHSGAGKDEGVFHAATRPKVPGLVAATGGVEAIAPRPRLMNLGASAFGFVATFAGGAGADLTASALGFAAAPARLDGALDK